MRIRSNGKDELRSQKSHYTNVSNATNKNVELSLEVELDDEVRSIIKNPEVCPSTLLDVTLIKPKGQEHCSTKTQILKMDQVIKLLEAMALDHSDKEKLTNKLFGSAGFPEGSERKASLGNFGVCSMYTKGPRKQSKPPVQQQVYTTSRTQEKIRSMFECKNKNRNSGKAEEPCLCRNCAIFGILTDSQKKPFSTEPISNPMELRDSRRPSRKKSVSFESDHDQCQAMFKLLSARIHELEKRLVLQEQKAIPRDYFKKIITKLVAHLSRLTQYTTEERRTSHRPKDQSKSMSERYYVNPVVLDYNFQVPGEKEWEPKSCASVECPQSPTDSLLKWGEEVLSSGRDLKNKVVVLLEETLNNLRKNWGKSQNDSRDDNEIETIIDELSKNLSKTVKSSANKTKASGKPKGPSKMKAEKLAGERTKPKRKQGTAVSVAYINPEVTRWPEESSTVSFKICSESETPQRDIMSEAKQRQNKKEFLRILANTKTTEKFKLWQTIWNQALENRQTKNDTVMIHIPDPKDVLRQRTIHLQYTIGQLEELLLKNHQCNKNSKK